MVYDGFEAYLEGFKAFDSESFCGWLFIAELFLETCNFFDPVK